MESNHKKEGISSPVHLKFEDLTVKINGKYILQNVSGEVKPGEVLALMGPSGAGKTTLLNILFGRLNGMEIETGKVLIDNQIANKRLRRKIGYVIQEDIFMSHLTVKQTLDFAGELSIPESISKKERNDIVENIIDQLSLKKCKETAMGGGIFGSGCSGGERKRCSIGIEMIKNPGMLILDEPTSGLDAVIAGNLIKNIKRLAENQGRSIITSIHQPSSHVFHMFDKLLLLSNGKVAYYGQTNEILSFFDSISMPCYPNFNPADYILEKISEGPEVEEKIIASYKDLKRKIDDIKEDGNCVDNEMGSIDFAANNLAFSEVSIGDNGEKGHEIGSLKDINPNRDLIKDQRVVFRTDDEQSQKWPTGLKTQVIALSKRSMIQTKGIFLDKFYLGQSFGIVIASILIWFNTPLDESSITDRNGIMFFLMMYLNMQPMFITILTFPTERKTTEKERASGMYRLSAYYIAKNISEFPIVLLSPLVIYTLVYWGTGLNRSPVFLISLLLAFTHVILSQSLGYCFAAGIRNLNKCMNIAIVFEFALIQLAGYFTLRMPSWLTWAMYISPFANANNIQIKLEYTYAASKFKCSSENSKFDVCNINGTGWITGEEISQKYSTLDLGIGLSFLILWGYILVCRCLFYIFLRIFNRPK